MIRLTTEQAQQIEEALMKIADLRNLGKIQPEVIAFETLYIIRAARAQEQAEQEPVSKQRILALAKQERVLIPGLIGFQDNLVEFARVIVEEVLQSAAPVQPVKQEPVYAFRRRGLNDFCTCTKERYEELADMPNLFEVTTFYAAPVSAPKQEPVAYFLNVEAGFSSKPLYEQVSDEYKNHADVFPLYAAPQPMQQEPVATVKRNKDDSLTFTPLRDFYVVNGMELYTAPLAQQDTHATHVVRTKDLTDDEIMKINVDTASIVPTCDRQFHFARAVIAADRGKNK